MSPLLIEWFPPSLWEIPVLCICCQVCRWPAPWCYKTAGMCSICPQRPMAWLRQTHTYRCRLAAKSQQIRGGWHTLMYWICMLSCILIFSYKLLSRKVVHHYLFSRSGHWRLLFFLLKTYVAHMLSAKVNEENGSVKSLWRCDAARWLPCRDQVLKFLQLICR